MFGMYRVYEDGKLIAEQKNKLTLLGRSNALSTMLGLTQSFAGSFGIGVSPLTNGSSTYLDMTDLDFNVGKYPITATSLGTTGTQDALVYTTRITDPSRYSIYELGLFSNQISGSVDVDALTLLNFESGDAIKETVGSPAVDYYLDDPNSTFVSGKKSTVLTDSINYRIGSNAVKLLTGGTIFANDATVDLSSFYNFDSVKLAFFCAGPVTTTIKFNNGLNYASYTFAYTPTTIAVTNYIGNGTTTATITTTSSHGLTTGDTVHIVGGTGTEQTKFNGVWTVASTPTPTTFTVILLSIVTTGTYTTNLGTLTKGGYVVLSKLKSDPATVSGTVDWSSIDRIDITISGGTAGISYAILDGLRIQKTKPTDSIDGLVSRAVLTTPILKEAGSIIDIEYLLVFTMDVT